jgi:hypothetical protein
MCIGFGQGRRPFIEYTLEDPPKKKKKKKKKNTKKNKEEKTVYVAVDDRTVWYPASVLHSFT